MTDLEMTKLCAEAVGFPNVAHEFYDPLHDDAQAMALVKRFGLTVHLPELGVWSAWTDLNRAIVECVAKMQLESAAKAGVSGPRDQIRPRG